MDAACTIQDSIHVFSLVRKYVSRILGTYHIANWFFRGFYYALRLRFWYAGNQINTEYCDEEAKLDTDKAPVFCGGKYFI